MPNKHKNSKLRTKLLLSGKLNKKKEVQSTLKYLAEKDAIEKEDIDFDFEKQPNDFGKLEDGDDDLKKVKNPKKRKNSINPKQDNKKIKLEKKCEENRQDPSAEKLIPKKSKKNKYFFMAHPEAFEKKDEILSAQSKNKYIIDKKKIEKNLEKKKTKSSIVESKQKEKSKKENLWSVQECSSEEDEEKLVKKTDKNKKAKSKNFILDITDIDKSFKIKKSIKKLEDGSTVEIFAPEIQQQIEESDEEQSDTDENPVELSENEEKDQEEINSAESIFSSPAADKLKSSRFRYLNELLYSQDSSKSFEFFKSDEDSFKAYHEGFKSQISKWPLNPLDNIIKFIKNRPSSMIVADLGCGEAKLAQSVKNKVHSFDFVAVNDQVTQCDMKNVPLEDNSCDVAVFCLSLMGTNVIDFICEAHRILKLKGVLKIAEVTSRINNKSDFIRSIESVGFKLVSKKDEINDPKEYFYFFDFVKTSPTIRKKAPIKLNPCLYKKR